jgi:hypothetical protein
VGVGIGVGSGSGSGTGATTGFQMYSLPTGDAGTTWPLSQESLQVCFLVTFMCMFLFPHVAQLNIVSAISHTPNYRRLGTYQGRLGERWE